MTRSITVAGTALCAILLGAVQIDMSAQTNTPAKAPAKATPAKAAPAKPLPARATVVPVEAGSITLTGCLQADGRKYMLMDPEGPKAEKGRSWKTGFITKKTKDVEVVAASSSMKLNDFRGHKVSVVGVRDGQAHLKARTIKQLVGSCS